MERLISTPLVTPLPPGFTPFPGFNFPPPRPADARAQARLELVDLQTTLRQRCRGQATARRGRISSISRRGSIRS